MPNKALQPTALPPLRAVRAAAELRRLDVYASRSITLMRRLDCGFVLFLVCCSVRAAGIRQFNLQTTERLGVEKNKASCLYSCFGGWIALAQLRLVGR